MIAALFVETGGVYFGIEGVEPWDEARDARKYRGPFPVVAHPPCRLWINLAAVNYVRWGGEHNRPGNDRGCFRSALRSVRKFGGVLEHPAFSKAWSKYGLQAPGNVGWSKVGESEYVCEVWQSAYGHRARKRTWLLYSGKNPPHNLNWLRLDGSHQVGFQDKRGKLKNKPTLSRKEAAGTPPLFRDELLKLARNSK